MPILEKNDNIKKYNEKKNYRQPQLKEIGKVNEATKGGSFSVQWDGSGFSSDTPS